MEQRSPRVRWLVVFLLGVFWIGAILVRLTELQLFRYSEYLARAQKQQQRIVEVSPRRGSIYDRSGHELAMSIAVDSCFADPSEISDPGVVARLLSRVLHAPEEELEAKLASSRSFVWIARKLPPQTASRIRALNLRGIYFQKENERFYPKRTLAAHVLGYVDVDEHGLAGVEYSFDQEIRGRPGRMLVLADARRRWYDRTGRRADPGASVVLTIDENIQYIAEKELARAIAEAHARTGTVVVQDPRSGELLAVANWPTFDPNDAGSYPDYVRMDRAVGAAYEPGSTFKLVTMAAALEEGVASPLEVVDCQEGKILVAGRWIHDWHPFGLLTVEQILAHSSDVGAIKIALRVGAPKFYDYMRAFGFGQPTGIDLPGENRGLLRPVENWSAGSIGSLAMGQEISVTPVQLISAVSAIANGGVLYPPRVVRELRRGSLVQELGKAPPRRVIDEQTAATLRRMMEDVVLQGTGKLARLDGYTDAGKTGTAQKIDPETGRYSTTRFVASFAGFAPVNEPAVTILVVLDSPLGPYHGGEVAGPVFRRIAQQTLAYLQVPHDVPASPPVETAADRAKARVSLPSRRSQTPSHAGRAFPRPATAAAATAAFGGDGGEVNMPALIGKTVRDVTELCSRQGLQPILVGSGIAVEQHPEVGIRVPRGARVTVRFEPAPGVPPVASRDSGK